jgi:hypothetical protein
MLAMLLTKNKTTMENSVNQSGAGSTKIYAVTWIHQHIDNTYTYVESVYTYSKYFPSKEEASEFANNLKSSPESWGANYDEYNGWDSNLMEDQGWGRKVKDSVQFDIHEIEVGKLYETGELGG